MTTLGLGDWTLQNASEMQQRLVAGHVRLGAKKRRREVIAPPFFVFDWTLLEAGSSLRSE